MDSIRTDSAAHVALRQRWKGQRGRLEVRYLTATDVDGTGWWWHAERMVPIDPAADIQEHGWLARYPAVHIGGQPELVRFAATAADLDQETGILAGQSDGWSWELTIEDAALDATRSPMFTFPRWLWDRELLPGAQVVDRPRLGVQGAVTSPDGITCDVHAAGARAHIYSHGSAPLWSWLHAELDPECLLEVVSASPHLPGPIHVPPRTFAVLRMAGRDFPRNTLGGAMMSRATLALPQWYCSVAVGDGLRIEIEVHQPFERSLQLAYPNPDGAGRWCTNSCTADCLVQLHRRRAGRWHVERTWELDGIAHSEVGGATAFAALPVCEFAPASTRDDAALREAVAQ